jgi:hypothetical protein
MTPDDRESFGAIVQRLALAFGRKVPEARQQIYFEALQPYPLRSVLEAAGRLRDNGTTFPTIAAWRALLGPVPAARTSDVRWMSADEASAYLAAERQGYEDASCFCDACRHAEITHRPLRFVPEFDVDDREVRVFCGPLNKAVVAGHWAHGAELARWYAAREGFFAHKAAGGRWARALALVGVREPGEEG